MQGVRVQPLVGESIFHMPQAKNIFKKKITKIKKKKIKFRRDLGAVGGQDIRTVGQGNDTTTYMLLFSC